MKLFTYIMFIYLVPNILLCHPYWLTIFIRNDNTYIVSFRIISNVLRLYLVLWRIQGKAHIIPYPKMTCLTLVVS